MKNFRDIREKKDGPCWPGYKQVGNKMKNGKEVPNCVPIDEANKLLDEGPTDKALDKKSKASGISKSILKKVFDRGVAAWKVGHKPGTTPAQWGMARVNSFITKGKFWYKHDSDLAKQV